LVFFDSSSLPTTIEPSVPAFSTIRRAGDWIARRTMSMPTFWSLLAGFSRSSERMP
jgi:hypothetical protein